MPELKAIYDSEDDIPESVEDFRSLFVEKGGKFELTGIGGIQTEGNVQRLERDIRKERDEHKATKSRLQGWGELGDDPTEIQAQLDRIPTLEAAAEGKLDKDKLDDEAKRLAEGIATTRLAPVQRDLKKAAKTIEDLTAENLALKTTERKREREDILRPLIVDAKILPEHQEDALLYAERHLERDEDSGNWFVKDGIDGLTAGATPKDWLAELVDKRPGWLPPNESGGARGSNRIGGHKGANPWASENWNVTEQTRIFREKGQDYAERLAKAAGTSIGGPRPMPARKT